MKPTTATPTLRPATCWTSFFKRTPVRAPAQPPLGPWARGPMAVGLRPVGCLRAGHQLVQHQAALQVCTRPTPSAKLLRFFIAKIKVQE